MKDTHTTGTDRRRIILEVGILYLGSCAVIRGIKAGVDGFGLSADWLVLVALVFLYTPELAARRNGYRVQPDILFPEPFLPALAKAIKWLVVLIILIYPLFILGYHLCQNWLFNWLTTEIVPLKVPYPRFFPQHGLPEDLLLQALYQLLCVGYAEEFFYRGYMQTRLNELFSPQRFRLLGADFGWSLPITALLFTVGHSLVTAQWWQPFILFPALIFGWLRARTGTIVAGAIFHAFANTAMVVLDHIYGLTA